MNVNKAFKIACELLEQHGLMDRGWSVCLDNAKRRFGQCRYRVKEISLSRPLIEINKPERVKDTILHEIAHALVGPGNGHNSVWKAKCIEVGCAPVRCYTSKNTTIVEGRYKAICTECGMVHYRHRKPANRSRIACICQKAKAWADKKLLTYALHN